MDVGLHAGGVERLGDAPEDAVQTEVLFETLVIGHLAAIEVGQLLELCRSNRALDIRVECSFCSDGDDLLLDGDVPPIEDDEKNEDWDNYPNDELEEMVPDVIDVGCNSLS